MSNPRRPHFGLSFNDENDDPVENVLNTATRPCQPRNTQEPTTSTPEPEASSPSVTPAPSIPVPFTPQTTPATLAPTPMSTHSTELKAALPADFSGKNNDATQWIKVMKAYFALNPMLYSSDAAKIMTTLNKMINRSGAPYAETWYDILADTSIANSEKTFNKFIQNFEPTFYPFNSKATTCTELSKLIQRSFKEKDRKINNGFQQFITDFQNLYHLLPLSMSKPWRPNQNHPKHLLLPPLNLP